MATNRHNRNLYIRSRNISVMLVTEFFLGMALNVLGQPDSGAPTMQIIIGDILMLLHVLVGLGLLIGSLMLLLTTTKEDPTKSTAAIFGMGCIIAAFAAGILTLMAPLPDLWSFIMAAGFMAALVAYARIWRAKSP